MTKHLTEVQVPNAKRVRFEEKYEADENADDEFEEEEEEEEENREDDNIEGPAKGRSHSLTAVSHPEALVEYFPELRIEPISASWSNVLITMAVDPAMQLSTPQDLVFETKLSHVVGMFDLRDLLLHRVLPVLQRPEFYEINGRKGAGFYPVQHNFFFYGRHGSGKRTLVRSFCAAVGLNLVEAFHPAFNAQSMLSELYQKALEHQPCVVLLNDCDVQFAANSPNVTALVHILKSIVSTGAGVWTIFRSERLSNILDCQLQELIDYSVWSNVPNDLQRMQIWALALSQYMEALPERSSLMPMVTQSENCVARNIFKFVRHSYCTKLARRQQEASVRGDSRVYLTLGDLEFPFIPTVGKRLTEFDPVLVNIQPFTGLVPVTDPKFAARR